MKSHPRLFAQKARPIPLALGPFRVFENEAAPTSPSTRRAKPLGQRLVEAGKLDPGDLVKALALQAREDVRLGDILVAHRMASEADVTSAACDQYQVGNICLRSTPPDPRLIDLYTPAMCLKHGLLPWKRTGSTTVIVTYRPELFARRKVALEAIFGRVSMAICAEPEILAAIEALRSTALVEHAEHRVPLDESCRTWRSGKPQRILLGAVLAGAACLALAPLATLLVLTVWAVLTLALSLWVKCFALAHAVTRYRASKAQIFSSLRKTPSLAIARLPVVSMMVPLFHEQNIAVNLLRRLSRLTYPKELLDICLVVEQSDTQTQAVLAQTKLPPWMRVIIVPEGNVQTKPRALNYALDFCRGSIIGVWDAEDAPAPDQIHKVVRRFHERGPDLACVQGQLDFYNSRANWLSRCFTIEYASWFRVMLPGLERLGFAVPLGGTTLFFQRAALEKLGGWDAHNVTEDADLGIRLARHGYRTEMLETTTLEEANCRLLPWIKQRSRWIKGYAMTYAVHMRDPVQLWHDLGARKFLGFQVVFLAALTQFLLAPLLWSFWLGAFGLGHPVVAPLPMTLIYAGIALFIVSELVGIAVGVLGTWMSGRRAMAVWAPSLHFYYPLAAFAAYKGFYEMVASPFYWDKTSHGHHDESD